jgi:hypothetical protein
MNPLTAKPKERIAARGPEGLDERDAAEHGLVARVNAHRKK